MRYTAEERSADFAALQEAASPAELHHALVMGWPAAFGSEASWPIELLRRVHGTDSDGVGETVALLATDPRWKSVAGLMKALVEADFVPDDALDLFAEACVAAGEFVWWQCPDDWFDEEFSIVISGDEDPNDSDGLPEDELPEDEAESPGPAVVRRRVSVDARRWAVHRLVTGDVNRWPGLYKHAVQAPRPVASALLLGLLDAADAVPEPAARHIESAAIASTDVVVRLAGLRRRAARDLPAALASAETDANERVRTWGRGQQAAAHRQADVGASRPVYGVEESVGQVQGTLF